MDTVSLFLFDDRSVSIFLFADRFRFVGAYLK
jgi:hypothetical protein